MSGSSGRGDPGAPIRAVGAVLVASLFLVVGLFGAGSAGAAVPGSSQAAGSDVPGSGVPGSGVPGSDVPGSDVPGSDVPGSGVPGSGVPGSTPPQPSGPAASAAPAAPDAPTGIVAAAGDGIASISWVAPFSDGGAAIVGYTITPHDVTASSDGAPVSTTGTSGTVPGLTNGDSYTFTVVATNDAGSSLPSSPSSAVTPQAGNLPPATATGTVSTD